MAAVQFGSVESKSVHLGSVGTRSRAVKAFWKPVVIPWWCP